MLIPAASSIGIFQGPGVPERRKQEYEYYGCQDTQLPVNKRELVDICQKLVFSVSAELYDGAKGK